MRAIAFLSFAAVVMVSCSTSEGPQKPKPGTPAFFFSAAQESYKSGNFPRTAENLVKAATGASEYQDRAEVWLMAVSSGLARAEMEWATTLDKGGKFARNQQLSFVKGAQQSRSTAHQHAMRATETAHAFMDRVKTPEIVVAFPVPAGSIDEPVELARAAKGIALKPQEVEQVLAALRAKHVILSAGRMGGAASEKDLDKARTALASGETKIKRETFLMWLAQDLVDLSELYGPKQLDQPARIRMLITEAQEAMQGLPASAETKALQKKIDAIAKKLPKAQQS